LSTSAQASDLGSSRLRKLVRSSSNAPVSESKERCDLCSEPIAPQHRHLLDLDTRELMCACRPCSILFDPGAAGGGHYRLVPERRLNLVDFELPDSTWERLRIPVEMAFFFRNSAEGRMMAFYPSPMGPTESLLGLDAWAEIERSNPVLETLEPDVEALLVNRSRGARQHSLVPIGDCYALVGVIRTRWRGLTGGEEVWEAINGFFDDLEQRSEPVDRTGKAHDSEAATHAAERSRSGA
jgi:Family of unknown function (DUF5947)